MQKSGLETMASRALLVDQALAEYGPEAKPARDLMRQALTESHDLFWRGADSDPTQLKVEVALKRWARVSGALSALDPKTAVQKDAIAAAKANLGLMEQTRFLMSLQLSSPVAWSLVTSVRTSSQNARGTEGSSRPFVPTTTLATRSIIVRWTLLGDRRHGASAPRASRPTGVLPWVVQVSPAYVAERREMRTFVPSL